MNELRFRPSPLLISAAVSFADGLMLDVNIDRKCNAAEAAAQHAINTSVISMRRADVRSLFLFDCQLPICFPPCPTICTAGSCRVRRGNTSYLFPHTVLFFLKYVYCWQYRKIHRYYRLIRLNELYNSCLCQFSSGSLLPIVIGTLIALYHSTLQIPNIFFTLLLE